MASSGNPLLDQYNKDGVLTPGLQRAMDIFKQKNIQQVAPLSNTPAPQQGLAPLGGAPAARMPFSDQPVQPQAAPAPLSQPQAPSPHQAELTRLTAPPIQSGPLAHTQADTGRSGIEQVQNPWLRNTLRVLDAVGSGFAPRLTAAIPGTQYHHNLLVNQEKGNVNQEQSVANEEQKRGLEGAQQKEEESLPQLHQTQAELAGEKAANVQRHNTAMEDIGRTRNENTSTHNTAAVEAGLRAHGFKTSEEGAIVPLPYEEMSEPQQAVHDLKGIQQEVASATADLRKAQAANQPTLMKMAQERIDNAQKNQSIALQRLGLSEKQFEMRAHGTENGEALPGAILGDDNKPVGTAFQANVRPTGQERNKADLASSAHDQLADIKSIVQKRPDIFGPAAGRKTDFTVWLGSQDPDAQRFKAARTIAGDHLAGVFGGRSEAALNALDEAIGHYKDNPAAITAGIDQLDKANQRFQVKGTPKTAGSDAAKDATAPLAGNVPTVKSQAEFDALPKGATYMEDGKKYRKP